MIGGDVGACETASALESEFAAAAATASAMLIDAVFVALYATDVVVLPATRILCGAVVGAPVLGDPVGPMVLGDSVGGEVGA